jgi:hypothetical protein
MVYAMNNILTPDYLISFLNSSWTLREWEIACRSNLEHEFKKKRMTKQDFAIAIGAVKEVVELVTARRAALVEVRTWKE